MQNFFDNNNIPAQIERRILRFLNLHWRQFQGYTILTDSPLLVEAPDPLIEQVQSARCLQYFQNCNLFRGLVKDKLIELTRQVDMVCMQNNEFVVIAGDITPYCYFIDEGYAEVSSTTLKKLLSRIPDNIS